MWQKERILQFIIFWTDCSAFNSCYIAKQTHVSEGNALRVGEQWHIFVQYGLYSYISQVSRLHLQEGQGYNKGFSINSRRKSTLDI